MSHAAYTESARGGESGGVMCGTSRPMHARPVGDIPRSCSPEGLLQEMGFLAANIEETSTLLDELEARLQAVLVPPPPTGESPVNRSEVQPAVAHAVHITRLHNSSVTVLQNRLKMLIGRINL